MMITDIVNLAEGYVAELEERLGCSPIAPDPDWLGSRGFSPTFTFTPELTPNISNAGRYPDGIIGQWQPPGQDNPTGRLDGGDSAQRTGWAAFCNSAEDQGYLDQFEISPGIMVRHPTEDREGHNSPNNCSRDQLLGYIAGCWRAKNNTIPHRLLESAASRFPPYTCQNFEDNVPGSVKSTPADFLGPHDVMALRIAAGEMGAHLDVLGQMWLEAAIRTENKAIDHERNQMIVVALLCGRLDLYVEVHPTWRENLRHYWATRGKEIGAAAIQMVEIELLRYRGLRRGMAALLPENALAFLQGTDWRAELSTLSLEKIFTLQARFKEACLKDTIKFGLRYGLRDALNQIRRAGATVDEFVCALKAADLSPQSIVRLAMIAGINPEPISGSIFSTPRMIFSAPMPSVYAPFIQALGSLLGGEIRFTSSEISVPGIARIELPW